MPSKRGLTLLELLIAIGLLLVVGALVFPTVMNGHRRRAFESTVEVVRNQLLLARAYAQATGEPVEVRYYSASPHVEARLFDPTLRAAQLGRIHSIDDLVADDLDEDQFVADQWGDRSVIPEAWAYRLLADGLRIGYRPPPADAEFGDPFESVDTSDANFDDEVDWLNAEAQPRTIRLAVFLPDGSALLGDAVWIFDDDGRRGRLEVNPWTGLPLFDQTGTVLSTRSEDDEREFDDEPDEFEQDELLAQDESGGLSDPPPSSAQDEPASVEDDDQDQGP